MDPAIIWDPRYNEHDTGGHIEAPDRAAVIVAHLEESDLWPRLTVLAPHQATVDDLLTVHTAPYVERVRVVAEHGGAWLDADTYVSARSYDVALLAVGGALDIRTGWQQGLAPFALIRPPGHHSMPDHAMGFCLFNNIAILARRLLAEGTKRVLILDWDVHHGNGTQAAFYDEPRVLFVSLHQWPFYPGTGWFSETGEGAGEGFTVNVPLAPGAGDGDYVHAFEALVEPIVAQYEPQAVLVSAGQDIHVEDILGSMAVSDDGFAQMALRAAAMAARSADGRLGFVLEGGYNKQASARAVEAVLRAVAEGSAPEVGGPTQHGKVVVAKAIDTQRRYWEL
jgi:acetoin utilization deacetylase AcuC-like enzyme